MRKGGGKSKGSQFERDVCRHLSLWVSNQQHEDVFWRSAMSGGRSTVAHAKGKRLAAQAGDISCIHPIGVAFAEKFLSECKFYADLEYASLLTRQGKLAQFWDETCQEAGRYGKLPFLIAKQNRRPTTVCLNAEGLLILFPEQKPLLLTLMTVPALDLYILDALLFFAQAKPPKWRQRERVQIRQ